MDPTTMTPEQMAQLQLMVSQLGGQNTPDQTASLGGGVGLGGGVAPTTPGMMMQQPSQMTQPAMSPQAYGALFSPPPSAQFTRPPGGTVGAIPAY